MQLVIRRDQADRRGMFGGHKGVDFSLAFQLLLSPVEAELVRRYKFEEMSLGTWMYQGAEVPITSVGEAIRGTSMQWPSVVELLNREREVKRACRTLKILLDVASTFGGEEVVDITADSDKDD
jgi:hypothetical protein